MAATHSRASTDGTTAGSADASRIDQGGVMNTFWAIVTIAFVVATLGVVGYGVVAMFGSGFHPHAR
jgi:hypothetical protein